VNDLAAYCTPVERVDSGYANLAHGPTKPPLLSLPSFAPRVLLSSIEWKPVLHAALVPFIVRARLRINAAPRLGKLTGKLKSNRYRVLFHSLLLARHAACSRQIPAISRIPSSRLGKLIMRGERRSSAAAAAAAA